MRRLATIATAELRKLRGEVITALAVAAVIAVLVSDTAAVVLGTAAIVSAALAALLFSAWTRQGHDSRKSPVPATTSGEAGDGSEEDPRVPIARARLMEIASRLALEDPSRDGRPSDDSGFEPQVSVIVPCYNDRDYVVEALESVRRQSYRSWECVIVDDASTDGSADLIEDHIKGDSRFRLIRREDNAGSGAARNRGIEAASGDYIAFLDADDLLLVRSLEDRVRALGDARQDPFVVGSFCAVRSESADVSLEYLPERRHATQPRFVDFVVAGGECPFPLHAPLVATTAVKSLEGFDESMISGAVDWDLWYRMLRNGFVFVPSRALGAIYRQKPGGITRSHKAGHTRASADLIRAAFQPADSSILRSPTAYPMTDPLGDYEARLVVADRAIRFAAMALAEEDVPEMRETLGVLEAGTWPLLDRHLDWNAIVGRGVARVVGLRPKHVPDLGNTLEPFVHTVKTAAEELTA